MATDCTDPIIIESDDDSDNDDVVLIKEEIEVDSEDCIFLSETKPTPKSDVTCLPDISDSISVPCIGTSTPVSGSVTTSLPASDVSSVSSDSLTSFSSSASLSSCTAQISLEDKISSTILAGVDRILNDSTTTTIGPLDLSSKSNGIDDNQADPMCPRTNENTTSDVSQNSTQDSSFLMLLTGSMDLQQTGNKSENSLGTSLDISGNYGDKSTTCDKTSVSDNSNNCDTTTGDSNIYNSRNPIDKLNSILSLDLSSNFQTLSQGTTLTSQDKCNNSNGQNITKIDTKPPNQVKSDKGQYGLVSHTSVSSTTVPTTQNNASDQKLPVSSANSISDVTTDPFKASHMLLSSMDLSLTSNSQPHSDLVSGSKNSQSDTSLQSSYPSSSTTFYNSLTLPLSQLNSGPKFNQNLKRSVSTNDAYMSYKSSFNDQSSMTSRSPSPPSPHHLPPKKQRRCYSSSSRDFRCINCDVNVAGKQYPRCPNGHATCQKCLEERVKLVLTGRAKESVRCLSKSCDSYYPISELRRSLAPMVVEILEDKLDLDYVTYISDLIVKEAAEDIEQDSPIPDPATAYEYEEINESKYKKKYEDCPSNWDSMDEREVNKKGFVLVPLEQGSTEYGGVVARFFDSMVDHNVECTNVYRVQNPILHKFYQVKKTEMIRDSEGFRSVVEGQLFHGTSSANVDAICWKGFDWRLCGKHGTMYGQGSYFAVKASYSHQYTDLRRPHGTLRSTYNQPMSMMTLPTTPSLLFPPVNVNFGQPLGLIPPSYVRPMNLSHGAPVSSNPMSIGMSHTPSSSQSSVVFSFPGTQSTSSQAGSSTAGSVQPGPSNVPGTSALKHNNTCLKRKLLWSRKILPKPVAIRNISGLASTALVTNMDGPSEPEKQKAFVFLANVLVGQYTVGNPKLRTPPPLVPNADQFVKRFDSCVDNKENPNIFVIFDSAQAYPEYLIEYAYSTNSNSPF